MSRDSPGTCLCRRSVQPRGEEPLDVAAAAGPLEASGDGAPLHHDERRDGVDVEALEQIRALFFGDPHHLERAMVAPTLQHLRQESLHTPTIARECRVEEDKPGLLL